jgi:trehalose/maltose hydrolase-like predicted phosphorylase
MERIERTDFWVSRVVENQDGSYSILNVVEQMSMLSM